VLTPVTEGKTGVPLQLLLTFVNVNDGTSFSADNVFSDGEQYQLCTIAESASIGGYDAALTVGIAL
jgi:hypothetical protein